MACVFSGSGELFWREGMNDNLSHDNSSSSDIKVENGRNYIKIGVMP